MHYRLLRLSSHLSPTAPLTDTRTHMSHIKHPLMLMLICGVGLIVGTNVIEDHHHTRDRDGKEFRDSGIPIVVAFLAICCCICIVA